MVFFNCNACGESVKKNQVEKHYQFQCRNCTVLSCVDCGKDFRGDAYKQHVKCMTEDEKYGGKNYQAKPNKGEKKQEAWIDQVQSAIDHVHDQKLKSILEKVKDYTNIPRKKNKFENFLKNSLRIQGNLASQAWDAISAEIAKGQQSANGNAENGVNENSNQSNNKDMNDNSQPETSTNENDKKLSKRERKEERRKKAGKIEKKDHQNGEVKKKKRKHQEIEEDIEEENETKKKKKEAGPSKKKKKTEEVSDEETEEHIEEEVVKTSKFNWEGIIVGLLRKADDKEMAMKKLRKKVLSAYHEHPNPKQETEEKILAKFNKKVTKNPKFRVLKDRVKLL